MATLTAFFIGYLKKNLLTMRIMGALAATFDGTCKFILIFVGEFPQSLTGVNAAEASELKSESAATPPVRNDCIMMLKETYVDYYLAEQRRVGNLNSYITLHI
jgi:hypothetical protein